MNRFDWNGLQRGDHVLLHGAQVDPMALTRGVVNQVDARKKMHTVSVAIPGSIRWCSRFQLHRDPIEIAEQCWRCHAMGMQHAS